MKSILVMCYSDPHSDPRPQRIIECLRNDYELTIASSACNGYKELELVRIERNRRTRGQQFAYILGNILRLYERMVWSESLRALRAKLESRQFDLIISHNLELLPVALALRGKGKVLFDAREYYPRQSDDAFIWRLFNQGINEYLCSRYMPHCDFTMTVSDGIAREYQKQYGVSARVVWSLPDYYQLEPSPTDTECVRIIHHGKGKPSRKIEQMIKTMDYVDDRFQLDLMLTNLPRKYEALLQREASTRRNVRMIKPVAFNDIIPFTNQYDIGLYNAYPSSWNMKYMLPNKLFEYIQARLAIVIGPSLEMSKVVEGYGVGAVASDYEPRSIAGVLNRLTVEKIKELKRRSSQAAWELSAERNRTTMWDIVSQLVSGHAHK